MAKKTKEVPVKLETMRHSCAHLMAYAISLLYSKTRFAIGPAIEDGFYYDVDIPIEISEKDLLKIEALMRKLQKKNISFDKKDVSIKKALEIAAELGQTYKVELIKDLQKEGQKTVTFYTLGDFIDLCSGPHVRSTSQIGPFKMLTLAGAYWRGDEKNKMLTRIYGTCFPTKSALETYLIHRQEALKRDHRHLGEELDLFMFDEEVGHGLPLWKPKGAFLRHKIMEFAFNTYLDRGYQPVSTPHIAREILWSHSGHLKFYSENMYSPFGIEDQMYRLKPMNCPFHVKIYNSSMRSYRDLPLRLAEMGTVYRYEKSGVLHGLTRVRGFTQDDAHIICTAEQLHRELTEALKLTTYILNSFGFKKFEMNLSLRDPEDKEKFIGDDQGWQTAETYLKRALIDTGYQDFVLDIGGAVFYGPKIDVKVTDALERKWQLSTIQVDFNLPSRFKMSYIDKDGKKKVPFMIHRALLGSLERFIGVFIEHCGGAFPVWLTPTQAIIIPITDNHLNYAREVEESLKKGKIRVEVDNHNQTTSAKIRDAELKKIPYMLVVGDKEIKAKGVNARARGEKNLGLISVKKAIELIQTDIDKKR
ncbi:MAG TPA: threonine--tRNA ligase [Candidatus Bathyarchaeia archaeon]|nr:threonine--tRNA ligase [Candidatus Bathyarchaeia archaeon]